MRFAKIFDVSGTQLLCVLQPSEEDGVPEVQVTTYIGGVHVSFGNRLVEVGAEVEDPAALFARTRELFDGMDQSDAENAYRLAVRFAAQARDRNEEVEDEDAEGVTSARTWTITGVTAEGDDAWTTLPMPSSAVH